MAFVRTDWLPSFYPEIVTHQSPEFKRQNHPEHDKAKSGDYEAALNLAIDIISEESVNRLIEIANGNPEIIVAPVSAIESQGANFIPDAMVEVISYKTGFLVAANIKQINSPQRTNKGAQYRMANQPIFAGDVIPGKNYIIADDHATLGATLANLKGFIESNGGIVIAATTLSASIGFLAPSDKSFKKIKAACGRDYSELFVNEFIKKDTGHEIPYQRLTRGEMGHIAKRISHYRESI